MNPASKLIIILCCIGFLTACSSAPRKEEEAPFTMLTPMLPPVKDPTTAQMEQSIKQYLKRVGAPAFAKYQFYRYDLDGDKRRDAIILLENPYKYWCNKNGCTLLIMKAQDNNFKFISKTSPLRAPFYISPDTTNGWHDLIVRVSGRWSKTKDVAMKFNGRTYPPNPEPLPAYKTNTPYMSASVFR